MVKAVWDVKSEKSAKRSEQVFDVMVAEFLLSYGKPHLAQKSVLAKYKAANLEEVMSKQQVKLAEMSALQELYFGIELPLTFVLRDMEDTGILLDVECLRKVGLQLDAAIINLDETIKKEVGYDINLNSSVQVGEYLVQKAGVPLAKTKTGRFATNEQELSQYAEQFPIISQLLQYRELTKLRSTYVNSLIDKVDTTGRIHTTYHQVAVNTGRLASSNPNMQNIPVTSEFGIKIKSCFVAPKGKVLLSLDYSQQELRILAHLTGEEKLIDAFKNNKDVHKITASSLFKVPYDEVTKPQRSAAKTINFGIIYGMGSYGMSQGLRIPVEEAGKFIQTFYETYPKIRSYYDAYLEEGKKNGFVETLLGRRRYTFDYPGQKFIDNNLRRVLINYPIQGSAADLMKKAMVQVQKDVLDKNEQVKLLLQIHDDLVFEVDDNEESIKQLTRQIREIMCSVYPLSVPIEVDVKMGRTWGEMEEVPSS